MGYSKVGARALSSESTREPEPEAKLTVACRFCGEELWRIDPKLDRKKDPITQADLEPAQKFKIGIPTYIPLDCPYCGDEVFLRGYHGGFFVPTLEKGEYPGARATRSGLRIAPGRFGWFYRDDRLRSVRRSMLGLPAEAKS